jgi:hypothetical protein
MIENFTKYGVVRIADHSTLKLPDGPAVQETQSFLQQNAIPSDSLSHIPKDLVEIILTFLDMTVDLFLYQVDSI